MVPEHAHSFMSRTCFICSTLEAMKYYSSTQVSLGHVICVDRMHLVNACKVIRSRIELRYRFSV